MSRSPSQKELISELIHLETSKKKVQEIADSGRVEGVGTLQSVFTTIAVIETRIQELRDRLQT